MDILKKARNIKKKSFLLPYISIVIKNQRVKLGMSQEELSTKIGIGLKTLRKIEQGDLNVNFTKLNYLLNFFGLGLMPADLVATPKIKKQKILEKKYILKILSHLYAIFKIKYGVCELALFGSYAKNRATLQSDIDILIDFDYDVSLETEGEIQLILENLFQGVKIDLTLKKNIYHDFKKNIEESKINVA